MPETNRELDVRVHQEVFGVEVEFRPLTNYNGYLIPEDWYPVGAIHHPANAIPHYSSDIAAAWKVVEFMLDWNGPHWWDDCSMRSHRSQDAQSWSWGAGFRRNGFPNDDLIVEARADTWPLAICRAALLAMETENA